MKELKLSASKNYNITITDGKDLFIEKCLPYLSGEKVAVITDSNLMKIYPDYFEKLLPNKKVFYYTIKAGEESKDVNNYVGIMNYLVEKEFSRNDGVITFGGGVVGDIGAFSASTYMRGINLIAVPTSLLAMVDSSVGGKTAINLDKGKNLCGTFYQPNGVYIDLSLLKTLPDNELKSGLGEILKYKYVDGKKNISLDKIDEELIYNCLQIKAEIVAEDEREGGKRKLLNFGHTFGHAVEKLNNFTLAHGICVAIGIGYALRFSEKYYNGGKEDFNTYLSLMQKIGVDFSEAYDKYDKDKLIEIIKYDKKRKGDAIEKLRVVPVKIDDIKEYI